MKIEYKKALNEVDQIINLLSEEDRNKISNSFKKFIKDNKSKFNEIDIVPYEDLEKQGISEEARAILYIIVKNFFK